MSSSQPMQMLLNLKKNLKQTNIISGEMQVKPPAVQPAYSLSTSQIASNAPSVWYEVNDAIMITSKPFQIKCEGTIIRWN